MRRGLFFILIIVMMPTLLWAQRSGRRFDESFEKYKSERVAFLTDALDLGIQEAEKFWPVYNEYQKKREALMKQSRSRHNRSAIDSFSDKQMKEMMDAQISNELHMAELKANYHEKYKKILPIKKVFILYHAEREFMSYMIKKMRESGRGSGREKRSRPYH